MGPFSLIPGGPLNLCCERQWKEGEGLRFRKATAPQVPTVGCGDGDDTVDGTNNIDPGCSV